MRASWILWVLATSGLAALSACAGSTTFQNLAAQGSGGGSGQDDDSSANDGENSADQSGETDEGGSDEPAWVNGSYLTCTWAEVVSESEASVGCGLHGPGGEVIRTADDLTWQATLADGTVLATMTTFASASASVAILLPSAVIPDVVMLVASATQSLTTPLIETLPGFDDPFDLASCLRGNGVVQTCLASVGIYLGPAPTPGPAPVTPTYSRAVVGGVAYYLGGAGESCTEVCSGAGGIHDATVTEIGSSGSALGCVDVLAELATISVLDNQTAAEGIGCHLSGADGLRVTTPSTTQDAKVAGAQRVCACQQ